MRRRLGAAVLTGVIALAGVKVAAGGEKTVIAHRGASGYLPEHTLEAKATAHAMGADFIEQDVVLTKDGVPVVLHDIHIDTTTDVAEVFPERARADGRFYAIDFSLAELKRLSVTERFDPRTGDAVYPGRFPVGEGDFEIATLAEEIELIQGMNASTGRKVGIYPEIKAPAWHRKEGQDISRIVLETLRAYGYRDKADPVFVQCFDWDETRRMRGELGWQGRLVQLIGENRWRLAPDTDFDFLRSADGIAAIAEVADGIGPWLRHVVSGVDGQGQPRITDLVARAHARGLVVHPYTLRADDLPDYAASFADALAIFYVAAGVDGVFTDFPDRAARFLARGRAGRGG